MSYSVKTLPDFDKEVKRIAKKHQGIKSDIAKLIDDLEENPTMGTDLGQNVYKISGQFQEQIKVSQVVPVLLPTLLY